MITGDDGTSVITNHTVDLLMLPAYVTCGIAANNETTIGMSYHSADIRIIVGSRGGYIASGRRGNNFSVNPVLLPYNATNISCTCNRGGKMAIDNTPIIT